MTNLVATVNSLAALFTFLTQVAIVAGIYIIIKKPTRPVELISKHATLLSFLIVLGAVLGSFFYSNIAGFAPCDLCWWQRIFIFSQLPLLAIAVWKKDNAVLRYTFSLSIVGAIIALYHSYIQYGGSALIPCGTDVNAVSCAVRYVFEWNYITIPMMSLSAFAILIVITLISRIKR